MADVDEMFKRLQAQQGVIGVIALNTDGIPIRTTMDHQTTVAYVANLNGFVKKCMGVVRDLDPTNELTFMRLRSVNDEIMISVEGQYILVTVQRPSQHHVRQDKN